MKGSCLGGMRVSGVALLCCFGYTFARFVAQKLLSTFYFLQVFIRRANANIIGRVRSGITVASHDELPVSRASLIPFSAGVPNTPPLFKCKKELDISISGAGSMSDKRGTYFIVDQPDTCCFLRSFWISHAPRALPGVGFLASLRAQSPVPLSLTGVVFLTVRGTPRALPRSLVSSLLGVIHHNCLYHPLAEGAYR